MLAEFMKTTIKLQYAVIVFTMLLLLLACLFPFFGKKEGGGEQDGVCTVALVPENEFTILSPNPITVKKGEPAEFRILLKPEYECAESESYRLLGDTVRIDRVDSDRSIRVKTVQKCRITIENAAHGSVHLSGDGGFLVPNGSSVSLTLSADPNYVIDGVEINDVPYPVPEDGAFSFRIAGDSTVRGRFTGIEKSFVLAKKSIGKVEVTGSTDDGKFHYGDELRLTVLETDGIVFRGWSEEGYLKDGGKLLGTEEEYVLTLLTDTEIYANFEDTNTYTASYLADHETGEIRPFAALGAGEHGELPLYGGVQRRDGYILTGFNTEKDLTGESYTPGSLFVMPHRNPVFYPEWSRCADTGSLIYQRNGNAFTVLGIHAGAIGPDGVLCIPDRIGGLPVTAVGEAALSGNPDLRTLILPPGIVSIGDRSFSNCQALQTVYLPETLSSIGTDCFAGCDAFSDLRILQSYAKIYDLDYDSALAEKYMRLKTTESPRILLVGGSNLCFGINSVRIREAFPKYDVVNFSTTHLYGLSPLLDMVDRNVRAGDVVILSPEYYPDMYCVRETAAFNNWEYVDCNPDMLKDVDIRNNRAFLNTILTFFYNKRANSPRKIFNSNPVYLRSGFNEYGDLMTKRTANKVLEPFIPTPALITEEGMRRINGAMRSYTGKGAICFFAFPSLSLGSNSRETVLEQAGPFLALLREKLDTNVITILSEFGDLLFPASYCYGNCFHLSLEGADLRTEQLVKDLSVYLER